MNMKMAWGMVLAVLLFASVLSVKLPPNTVIVYRKDVHLPSEDFTANVGNVEAMVAFAITIGFIGGLSVVATASILYSTMLWKRVLNLRSADDKQKQIILDTEGGQPERVTKKGMYKLVDLVKSAAFREEGEEMEEE